MRMKTNASMRGSRGGCILKCTTESSSDEIVMNLVMIGHGCANLNMYLEPPSFGLSLDEFEEYTSTRTDFDAAQCAAPRKKLQAKLNHYDIVL